MPRHNPTFKGGLSSAAESPQRCSADPGVHALPAAANVLILQQLLGHESLARTGKYTGFIVYDLIVALQMKPVTAV
jgi:hypothetical protein